MNWLFDSHIHLSDPEYDSEMLFIIKTMEKLQIKTCCVSTNNSDSKKTLQLAKKSNLVLPFIGIHPANATEDIEGMMNLINQNTNKITGIGEIGLDRTYVESDEDFERQKLVFESLLSLAEKCQKPVSIHSRKALDEIYEIMPSYSINGVQLHWFDGNKKQLQKALDMEFFISFGPVMVYANDKQVLLSKTDNDKILVETDGPVKFSKCFGFKSAHVSFLPSVVFCASKILKQSYDELSATLEKNSKNFLSI